MALEQGRVCSFVLEEAFGEVVAKTGSFLISNGPSTLHYIHKTIKKDKNQIKKSLLVLIQHQLVSYTTPKPNQVLYRAELSAILGVASYPRHIHTGQELADDTGRLVVEDILLHGQTPLSHCVRRVTERLNATDIAVRHKEEKVKKVFEGLVEDQYLVKVKTHSFDNKSSHHPIPLPDKYTVPILTVNQLVGRKRGHSISEGEEPVAKRSKSEDAQDSPAPDEDILWFINVNRFHLHYRHQSIVQAVGERIDPTSAIIMKAVIQATVGDAAKDTPINTPTGTSVFPSKILECLPGTVSMNKEGLDQYLSLLIEEKFLIKTGDAGGGSYCINYKTSCEMICLAVLESIVRERFGSKPLRLFKLLLQKGHLEQKQVSDMALIPNKESKEMLYSLLAENFVSLQEIPRANDYTPSRTFYLFSVNKVEVARVVMEKCYKSIGNLMSRRMHEASENKRLLEKYSHWEKQQAQLEQQAQSEDVTEGENPDDLEELITPSEKKLAKEVLYTIERLMQSELQVDNTVFIIEDYLNLKS